MRCPSATWGVSVLASIEILLGALILYWGLIYGVHDQSSLGSVFFLWGTAAALVGFLIPGLLLFVHHPMRWLLQTLPLLLALSVAFIFFVGFGRQ